MATAARSAAGVRGDWIGISEVVAAVVVWGFSSIIVPVIHVHAVTFVFYRSWLGALMMACALLVLRYRPTRRSVMLSLVAGILFSSYTIFLFEALKHTAVGEVSAISSLQPALTLLVAAPLFGEVVTRSEVAGTFVGIAAIFLVVFGGGLPSAVSLRGDVMALGALVVWTVYFLAAKRIREEVDATEFVAIVMLVSAVLVTPFAFAFGSPGVPSTGNLGLIAAYSVLATAGNLFVIWAHPRVDTTVSSLVLATSPIVAALLALIFLGQHMAAISVLGIFVAVAAMGYVLSRATSSGNEIPAAAESATPRQ
jgi:drug/metabolite transporter, DME family